MKILCDFFLGWQYALKYLDVGAVRAQKRVILFPFLVSGAVRKQFGHKNAGFCSRFWFWERFGSSLGTKTWYFVPVFGFGSSPSTKMRDFVPVSAFESSLGTKTWDFVPVFGFGSSLRVVRAQKRGILFPFLVLGAVWEQFGSGPGTRMACFVPASG